MKAPYYYHDHCSFWKLESQRILSSFVVSIAVVVEVEVEIAVEVRIAHRITNIISCYCAVICDYMQVLNYDSTMYVTL